MSRLSFAFFCFLFYFSKRRDWTLPPVVLSLIFLGASLIALKVRRWKQYSDALYVIGLLFLLLAQWALFLAYQHARVTSVDAALAVAAALAIVATLLKQAPR